MLYEIGTQLQQRAGTRQVTKRPKTAVLQSHGYGGENLFVLKV
jgi:hypothetical protein